MTEEDTIREGWVHLANLGRRISELDDAEKGYKDPAKRIKHLLVALPAPYKSMRTTINAQKGLKPEEILMLLES